MTKLIFLRHGESEWNKAGKFTGWVDVGLTDRGRQESEEAGNLLKEKQVFFDVAFTSYLRRAYDTLDIVLRTMGKEDVPTFRSWRLNERHYGVLQGLDKRETSKKEGEKQVYTWRRSWDIGPPRLSFDDSGIPHKDSLYENVPQEELPLGESLQDATNRILPYWYEKILPEIKKGNNVIVCVHGSTIRGLVKFLENFSAEEVRNFDVPYCVPLVYEFGKQNQKIRSYYLGDPEIIKKKEEEIRTQAIPD